MQQQFQNQNTQTNFKKLFQTTNNAKNRFKTNRRKGFINQISDQPPNYFQNIAKNQRKVINTKNFVRKLKQSAVLQRNHIEHHHSFDINPHQQQGIYGVQIGVKYRMILSALTLLHIWTLSIIASLGIVFEQVQQSKVVNSIQIVNIIFHFTQIILKVVINQQQQDKIKTIYSITKQYLKNNFWHDFIILVILILDVINIDDIQYLRIMYLIKIPHFKSHLRLLEDNIINNMYKEHCWQVIKIILFNFIFAHCLAIILTAMSKFDQNKNWIIAKGIQNQSWENRYIWAYYWATTIMMSVGFGDITATNSKEALGLVFVQIFGCLILSYNFNRIGGILTEIQRFEVKRQKKAKVFRRMNQDINITKPLKKKINNFIREQARIKRNYKIQDEEQFVEDLPTSFKNELLIELHSKIFQGLSFFRSLSKKMISHLSTSIKPKVAHPQEVIMEKGQKPNVIILTEGEYELCLNRPNLSCHGYPVQVLKVQKDQKRLLSLDFLTKQQLTFDVKTKDYALIYTMTHQKFIQCLKENSFDYQYFCMKLDENRYVLNPMELWCCQLCIGQKHTLFKCPKLHYIPIPMHIADRKWQKAYNFLQKRQLKNRNPNKFRSLVKSLENIKLIMRRRTKGTSNFVSQQQCESSNSQTEKSQQIIIPGSKKYINENAISQNISESIKKKLNNVLQKQKGLEWDLNDCDLLYDFKYYFPQGNPSSLTRQKKRLHRKRYLTKLGRSKVKNLVSLSLSLPSLEPEDQDKIKQQTFSQESKSLESQSQFQKSEQQYID